eukprot:gb/GECG01008818.1/.p1 GENE.gb/GECG01008818.1/~~gb/GECG01008818.1/.p1  ORF type:complete len:106 (+),score=13.21 gb/GECG01008818.1/:1-318(+)
MKATPALMGKFSRRQFIRAPLNPKQANKNFYKGKGGRRTGVHTSKGGFHIQEHKKMEIIAPDLSGFKLKPYVSLHTPHVKVAPHDQFRESHDQIERKHISENEGR